MDKEEGGGGDVVFKCSAECTLRSEGDERGQSSTSVHQLSKEEQEPSPPQENELIALFDNDLIVDKLTQYLTLADMKAISEVCIGLSRSVRKAKAFVERAMLLICKETVALDFFLVDSYYPWKLAQVDVSLPVEVIDIIPHILETVHTVQIRVVMRTHLDEKDLVKFILFLLHHTPNLTTLQIESSIMEKVLYDVFSDLGAQNQLKKLKCLEICSWSQERQSIYYIDGTDGDEGPFPRNFLQISLIPLSLETFKMAKICTISGGETEHVKFIPNIVSANQDTLTDISLHLNIWRLDDMKSIRCHRLKRLTITAYERDASVVIAFLTNQPLLEELSVDMREGFPISVLHAVQGKCTKLKKLHLKGKSVTGVSGAVDWGFLKTMGSLEDVFISRPLCIFTQQPEIFGTGWKFFSWFPEKIKKIGLKGMDQFWCDPVVLAAFDRQPVAEIERIVALEPFSNITELSLMRCPDAFNDAIAQHVFNHFGKLRKLEISHCHELTDFGLTGKRDNEDTGISLQNLKALTEFTIRACHSVTTNGLLQAVQLPYLRSFDYLSVIAANKAFIVKIVEQNPSLESISIFVSDFDDIQALKGELKKINRRLRKFCNLNEEDWVDENSDSDADSYRDFDSDISGGPHPHPDFDIDEDDQDYEQNEDGFMEDDYDDDDFGY